MIKFRTSFALLGALIALGGAACSSAQPSADVGKGSTAPLIATGTVRKAVEGKPVAPVAGATITLTWMDDRGDAKPGDTITPEVLAKATTDRDGRFSLHGKPTASLIDGVKSNGDYANVEILVEAPNGDYTSWAVTRKLVSGTWGTEEDRPEYSPGTKVNVTYRYDAKGTLTNGGTQ